MSRFFIDRPVFAWVLAIVIMLAGALAVKTLPVAQYPSIAPPAISISVTYPGASAETVQDTVVQVIEQQLSGLDGLMYFSSESTKDGSMSITLNFAQGTDPDIAQVQVQNKLNLATPQLPAEVQQQGIRVAKATTNFLMIASFVSTDGRMSGTEIGDTIATRVQDPLSRTAGVGDYQLLGTQQAMRIWLDPAKLNSYQLTPLDVRNAIQVQNVQIASGELGGLPAVSGQQLNATIIGPQRLRSAEQFGAILLTVAPDGSQVLLRDVAEVGLGAESYGVNARYNGKPAAAIAIKLAPGANALDTAAAVRQTLADLQPYFPQGLEVKYPLDSTPFVRASIRDVVTTLFEAVALVFLVMLLFLQNLRATLIPTIAVPVVLLGTFGVLALFGYSINTLTMFAMVLAIGLLVDDAIVVVENVERVMSEEGLSPKDATIKSMKQITGALFGIGLVLSAVFLPMAFFGGSTGVIYRQFSITIVAAMTLSVLVALFFTPALCASLLKPVTPGAHGTDRRGLFGWFNRVLGRGTRGYVGGTRRVLGRRPLFLAIYALIAALMIAGLKFMPSGFLPDEDQGSLFITVSTPPGATQPRTQAVLDEVSAYLLNDEKANVESVFTVAGFSFGGRGQSAGQAFVKLKDWSQRKGQHNSVQMIASRAMQRFAGIRDAQVFAFAPPGVPELGNATGFNLELQDQAGLGHEALIAARNQFLGMAAKNPKLVGVRPNGFDDEPQFKLDIDWEKARALGVSNSDINDTLSSGLGSTYVNQFIDKGRVKKVYLQGMDTSRMAPEDIGQWFVRNASGTMTPFSAFSSARWAYGSPKLERYNGVPAVQILGMPAPGQGSGTAMSEVAAMVKQLPAGIGMSWTGLSYEETRSGSQAPLLYAVSLLVVFLCLAALYESWAVPLAVMMVVPLGVFGVVLASMLRGMPNDVFFQVGLLTTAGLSAKNAILIVEFAKENYDRGMELVAATLHAAEQRLRPILMTSIAFILGVLPLALSTGAGAGGQNAIGTGVIGGMISGTVLAVFFVPLFYVAVMKLFQVRPTPTTPAGEFAPGPVPTTQQALTGAI